MTALTDPGLEERYSIEARVMELDLGESIGKFVRNTKGCMQSHDYWLLLSGLPALGVEELSITRTLIRAPFFTWTSNGSS